MNKRHYFLRVIVSNLQPLGFFPVVFLLGEFGVRGFVLIFLLLFCGGAYAAHKMPERQYQKMYCPYNAEYRLSDGTRVDCLTAQYAIEFDFAPKWAEALGQSLHYARMTGRNPAIFLILENDTDMRYVRRLAPLCQKYGVWLTLIRY